MGVSVNQDQTRMGWEDDSVTNSVPVGTKGIYSMWLHARFQWGNGVDLTLLFFLALAPFPPLVTVVLEPLPLAPRVWRVQTQSSYAVS